VAASSSRLQAASLPSPRLTRDHTPSAGFSFRGVGRQLHQCQPLVGSHERPHSCAGGISRSPSDLGGACMTDSMVSRSRANTALRSRSLLNGVVRPVRLAVSIWSFALLASAGQTAGMFSQRHAPDGQLDTATWCRQLIPQGSVYAFLADHRQHLFPPALFAAVPPPRLRAPLGARRGGRHGDGAAGPGGPERPRSGQCVAARHRLEGRLRIAAGR
jgi:hypothetical protein